MLFVKDITLTRGQTIVCSGLSFSLAAGSMLCLRGPNGSGKSSVLGACAGLLEVDAGDIVVTASIEFLGHRLGLNNRLTVAEVLVGRRDPVTIELFKLAPIQSKFIYELSAGQKKRVALARLYAAKSKLWLLDEPFVSLDAHWQQQLRLIMQQHCAAGGSILLSSHQQLACAELLLPKLQQQCAAEWQL